MTEEQRMQIRLKLQQQMKVNIDAIVNDKSVDSSSLGLLPHNLSVLMADAALAVLMASEYGQGALKDTLDIADD